MRMSAFPQTQGFLGQGCGFVDLDADGDPDVVLLGASDGTVGIFENTGAGVFVDRSSTSGIPLLTEQEGFAAADFNADGLPDLYITQHSTSCDPCNVPNLLLENNGGFTFTDVALQAGVADNGPGTGVAWGDYNLDGWPDLYVCNYSGFPPYDANRLFRNKGDGSFAPAPLVGVNSLGDTFQVAKSVSRIDNFKQRLRFRSEAGRDLDFRLRVAEPPQSVDILNLF